MVVVDGRIGYIGGFGFAEGVDRTRAGQGPLARHRRARDGPIVNRMQGAFCENWIEETGEIPAGQKYFPVIPPAGQTAGASRVHLADRQRLIGAGALLPRHQGGETRDLIQNPYMLPDDDAIKAMAAAVKRGVDVHHGAGDRRDRQSDRAARQSSHVRHAAEERHQGLRVPEDAAASEGDRRRRRLVVRRLDEFRRPLVPAQRRDQHGLLDPKIAEQLRASFNDDMRFAKQRSFAEWRSRPLWHKAIDGLAYLGHGQL
jgi:cardiolipin synthase